VFVCVCLWLFFLLLYVNQFCERQNGINFASDLMYIIWISYILIILRDSNICEHIARYTLIRTEKTANQRRRVGH